MVIIAKNKNKQKKLSEKIIPPMYNLGSFPVTGPPVIIAANPMLKYLEKKTKSGGG